MFKKCSYILTAVMGLLTASVFAADTRSNFRFGPCGGEFSACQTGDDNWTRGCVRPNGGDLTIFGRDHLGQNLSDTCVVRLPNGCLVGSTFNMQIGPYGSYFGSGNIHGANQLDIGNSFGPGGGSLSLHGVSYDGRHVPATLFQAHHR